MNNLSNKKIKLLGIYQFFYPFKGGSPKYEEELYTTLLQSNKNVSIDVLCYNTENALEYEEYRGMRIYRVPCFEIVKGRFYLANPIKLIYKLYQLSKNNYTHVHTDIRFFDTSWWSWFYAKLIGAVSIFTGHNASFAEHEKKYVGAMSKFLDKTIVRFAIPMYDEVFYISRATQKFYENVLKIKRNSKLIFNSVNTEFFTPTKGLKSRTIPVINKKLSKEDVLITFVGRVTWTKGLTYYIESIKKIVEQDKKKRVYFVIAGKGDLLSKLKADIKKFGISDRVFTPGALSYKDVSKLLKISDVFINPSHHNEGLPTTILEAGASGCFVIATDNGGTKEVIKDMKTGLLVPQRDPIAYYIAIKWFLNHRKQAKNMVTSLNTKITKNYNWKNSAKKFYQILVSSDSVFVQSQKDFVGVKVVKNLAKAFYVAALVIISPFINVR